MTDLPERMVEAAARAILAQRLPQLQWNIIPGLPRSIALSEVRAALTAALAVAEGEGVVLCKVPELIVKDSRDGIYQDAYRQGHNESIANTLAGRVTL